MFGVHNNELFSKSRTIEIRSLDELEVKNMPNWSFMDKDQERSMNPINIFNCPFRGQNGIIVFCKTGDTNIKSKNSNGSYSVAQDYYIINPNLMRPYGFLSLINPDKDLNFVSGVGLQKCYGRKFADLHYKLCLATGIRMTELSCSNSPSKWNYTIEANTKNDLCVHLWMSRYILHRVGENCNVIMNTNPSLDSKHWNECLCVVNLNGVKNEYCGDIDVYNV